MDMEVCKDKNYYQKTDLKKGIITHCWILKSWIVDNRYHLHTPIQTVMVGSVFLCHKVKVKTEKLDPKLHKEMLEERSMRKKRMKKLKLREMWIAAGKDPDKRKMLQQKIAQMSRREGVIGPH